MLVDSTTKYDRWHLPTAFAVSAVCLGYEVLRRRHRLVFVPHGHERVGVYRRRTLLAIARPDDFRRHRLSLLQTFRQFVAFGLLALIGSFLFFVFLGASPSPTALLISCAGMICGWSGLIATTWSRIMCIQFVLDRDTLEADVVVLRRAHAAKMHLRT